MYCGGLLLLLLRAHQLLLRMHHSLRLIVQPYCGGNLEARELVSDSIWSPAPPVSAHFLMRNVPDCSGCIQPKSHGCMRQSTRGWRRTAEFPRGHSERHYPTLQQQSARKILRLCAITGGDNAP